MVLGADAVQSLRLGAQVSELNRRMKSSNEEVKLLTKLKHDIENEAKSMQERVDALQVRDQMRFLSLSYRLLSFAYRLRGLSLIPPRSEAVSARRIASCYGMSAMRVCDVRYGPSELL